MPRTGDHLITRPGSRNFYVELAFPRDLEVTPLWRTTFGPHRHFVKSMGTPVRLEAQAKASQYVAFFHIAVFLARNPGKQFAFETSGYEHADGLREIDGRQAFVSGPKIVFLNADGTPGGEIENKSVDRRIMPDIPDQKTADAIRAFFKGDTYEVPKQFQPKAPDPDIAILEFWIKQNKIKPDIEREARAVFATFKQIRDGKLFQNANFDDGVALADHFYSMGNKSATVKKKVGHLRAAVHLALENPAKYPRLKMNPFSGRVVADHDDAEERDMFDDNDMQVMFDNLDNLDDDERTLYVLLATTGMGAKEAFEVESEMMIDGFRCVRIGTKTVARRRIIPIPKTALPYLPKKIEGPLFENDVKNTTRNLNRAIQRFNLTKTTYGLRHRASYKLKGVEDSLRWEVLGHEGRKKPSENYGRKDCINYPMEDIARAINKIGLR